MRSIVLSVTLLAACNGGVINETGDTDNPQDCGDPIGEWHKDRISSAVGSAASSIAVASDGTVHALFNQFDDMVYAVQDGSRWEDETIASSYSSGFGNLLLDEDDAPHATVGSSYYMTYLTKASGSWETVPIDFYGSVGNLVLEGGTARLAYQTWYYEGDEGYTRGLAIATWNGSSWDSEEIADNATTSRPSLAVAPDGAQIVAWVDHEYYSDEYNLRVVTDASGDWAQEELGTWAFIQNPVSLHVDGSGAAHIGLVTDAGLQYVHNTGGDWEIEVVTSDMPIHEDVRAGLTVEDDGTPHFVFTGGPEPTVRHAVHTGAGWEFTDVATSDDTWAAQNTLVDEHGAVHTSYHDGNSDSLFYATNLSQEWVDCQAAQ